MLSKLSVAFKSALPLTLIVSPLLLAAARPMNPGPHQFPCNVPAAEGALSTSASADSDSYSRESAENTADASGVGGPSLLNNRWATALRLLLSNRYTQEDRSEEGIANTPATEPTENNCLAQQVAANETPDETLLAQVSPAGNEPFAIAQEPDLLPILGAPPAQPLPNPTLPTLPPVEPVITPPPAPVLPTVQPTASPTPTPIRSRPTPLPARQDNNTPLGFPLERPSSVDPTNVTPTTVNPTPFDGSSIQTLAARPDGNYRYIAGRAESRAYTNAEIQQRGGAVFVLKKEGNRITGNLFPRDGSPGICVTGVVSGDTISGSAYPHSPVASMKADSMKGDRATGESFEPYGNGALQVRRINTAGEGEQTGLYYASAVLDLSDFSMINAGAGLPPERCQVVPTVSEAPS